MHVIGGLVLSFKLQPCSTKVRLCLVRHDTSSAAQKSYSYLREMTQQVMAVVVWCHVIIITGQHCVTQAIHCVASVSGH